MSPARRYINIGFGIAFALAIPACIAWPQWDMHRLRSFCGDVRPGTPVSELVNVASDHWVDTRWLSRKGITDKRTNLEQIFVPAESQMGDMVCSIKHDGTKVISAEVWGPGAGE